MPEIIKDSQARKYLITINNPESFGYSHELIAEILKNMNVTYFCMVDEIGNETGTYHTHVFLYSPSPIRFTTLKHRFAEAHIDKARGSCPDNINYLRKQGKWAESDKAETTVEGTFEEFGTPPSERAEKEPDMAQIIEMFDSGCSVNDVIDMMPKYGLRVNELESLRELRNENRGSALRKIDVSYIFGDTGTGKTYSVFEKYDVKDICRITNYSEKGMFDSYHSQKILVFDEFHSQISIPQMLMYLDIYPVELPARYHDRKAAYTEVYILSNIPLWKQYESTRLTDRKTWDAFLRRINHVYHQISIGNRIEVEKGNIFYE